MIAKKQTKESGTAKQNKAVPKDRKNTLEEHKNNKQRNITQSKAKQSKAKQSKAKQSKLSKGTALHSTALHSTAQHSTAQHSTVYQIKQNRKDEAGVQLREKKKEKEERREEERRSGEERRGEERRWSVWKPDGPALIYFELKNRTVCLFLIS